ncbi:MAG: phosphoglycerate dehydrogenase [Candidatus Latescibacterota bacterium]|nr:MAG: phosphoglycerate dehydrogenase [Candidatus Latescibacterota bacterium]
MRILVTDSVAQEGIQVLKDAGFEVEERGKVPAEELRALIPGFEGLIVRSATKVPADVIEAARNLRAIGRAGTGVDTIDVDAATRKGIVVMNTPGGNTISTAEHTFSLLLALSRNIPQAVASVKRGEWDRKRYVGVEVMGKTLGIIGVGRVGREVAIRARAFGMRVLGYDPYITPDVASKAGVELVELERLLGESDYISVHTPRTESTYRMISRRELEACKPGVRIINCARGGIVDEEALLEALESGKVAGAALDVYEEEPPRNRALVEHPKVICTPHLGASTVEAQVNVALQIARQMVEFFRTGVAPNAVNLPPVDPEVFRRSKKFLELAEKIGRLQSQLGEGRLLKVTVEYRGEVLEHPTSLLTAAVLKGALEASSEVPLNLVNAPYIARERGVQVEEVRYSEHRDYLNLIAVYYRTDREERVISGTIFGKNDPRIVRIDEYHFDARPEGEMLFCGNEDVPGVIGRIGTLLGSHGINIARMSWGREQPGGKAVTVLNLDHPVSDEILEEIRSQPHILWAKRAKL